MVPMIPGMTQKEFIVPWNFIKENLGNRSTTTAFVKRMGMNIWKYLESNPVQSQLFKAGETRLLTRTLIEDYRDTFQGLDSLVDVGGAVEEM
ncbi:hypothetical protein MKW92_047826, partial [Papaver armeniacum]